MVLQSSVQYLRLRTIYLEIYMSEENSIDTQNHMFVKHSIILNWCIYLLKGDVIIVILASGDLLNRTVHDKILFRSMVGYLILLPYD